MSHILETGKLVRTLRRWMLQTLQAGKPIVESHVRTWAEALGDIDVELDQRDRDAANTLPVTGVDRLDAIYAENMLRESIFALERTCLLAAANAEPAIAAKVRADVRLILDTLEALALGVARPSFNPTQGRGG